MALLSTSLVSLITAYFAIIHSVHELLITRVAQAVATQFLIASSLGLAAEVTSVGGVGFSTLRFGQGVGIALGVVLGGFITSLVGPRTSVLVASLIAVLPIPTYLLLKLPSRGGEVVTPKEAIKEVAEVLKNPYLLGLLPLAISEVLGYVLLLTYYTSYLVSIVSWSPIAYSAFLAAEAISFSLGSLFSEKVFSKFGIKSLLLSGLGLSASYLILYLVSRGYFVILATVPIGLFSGLVLTPVYSEAAKVVRVSKAMVSCAIDTLVSITYTLLIIVLDATLIPSNYVLVPAIASLVVALATTSLLISSKVIKSRTTTY